MGQAYDIASPNKLQQSGYIILILQTRNLQIWESPSVTWLMLCLCAPPEPRYTMLHMGFLDTVFPEVNLPYPSPLPQHQQKIAHLVALVSLGTSCSLCKNKGWLRYLLRSFPVQIHIKSVNKPITLAEELMPKAVALNEYLQHPTFQMLL